MQATSDEEIKQLRLDPSEAVDIEKFVPIGDIDPMYYDQTWYVVAKDKRNEDAFAVIREAMLTEEMAGFAHLVMSRMT